MAIEHSGQDRSFIWPAGKRIEICGALGTGKTTLLRLLADFGCTALYEPAENNPYLAPYYANPRLYAFEKCGFFALDYLHTIKRHLNAPTTLIVDISIPLMRAYQDGVSLSASGRRQLKGLLDEIETSLPPTDLYIHLVAEPQQILRRIARRGRTIEAGVDVAYIETLNTHLTRHLADLPACTNILTLDMAELEGKTDMSSIRPVAGRINAALLHTLEKREKVRPPEPAQQSLPEMATA